MAGHFGPTSQVDFYALPEDIDDLGHALRAIGPLTVLHARSSTQMPRVVAGLNFVEAGHRWLFYALARPDDLPHVRMRHVVAQSHWVVDGSCSPVVEFSSCFHDGRLLRRGRMYATPRHHDGGVWVQKNDAFVAWAKRLMAVVRRRFPKHGTDRFGPRAREWVAGGGRVE